MVPWISIPLLHSHSPPIPHSFLFVPYIHIVVFFSYIFCFLLDKFLQQVHECKRCILISLASSSLPGPSRLSQPRLLSTGFIPPTFLSFCLVLSTNELNQGCLCGPEFVTARGAWGAHQGNFIFQLHFTLSL